MPVLKDVECMDCGCQGEEMVGSDVEQLRRECPACGEETDHRTLVGGGRLKPFITAASFAGREWSDEEVECQGVTATIGEHGEAVTDLDKGDVIHDRPQYGAEERSILRDQMKSATRRNRGQAGLVFDLGSKRQ